MCKRLICFMFIISLIAMSGNALAGHIWEGGHDRLWTTPCNWEVVEGDTPAIPEDGDLAHISDTLVPGFPIIQAGMDIKTLGIMVGYETGDYATLDMTGGTYTSTGGWTSFGGHGSAGTGIFTMTGGQWINEDDGNGNWYIGGPLYSEGSGTVIMEGGVVYLYNEVHVANGHPASWGRLFLKAGVITCEDLKLGLNYNQDTFNPDQYGNGLVLVDDGIMFLKGNQTGPDSYINLWIAMELIDANDPTEMILLEYDPTKDLTKVWADTPDPAQTGKAIGPTPHYGDVYVARDASVLTWGPGWYTQDVNGHIVYFGTDYNDVNEATTSDTSGVYRGIQDTNSYTLTAEIPFEMGKTYYWRVDQVNDVHPNNPWKGSIWEFTAVNHWVIDDMESYDYGVNLIGSSAEEFAVWVDGASGANGSVVTLIADSNVIQEVVQENDDDITLGNAQAMMYTYTNTELPYGYYYSEAVADTNGTSAFEGDPELRIDPNWDTGGVRVMDIWFYGNVDNDINETERMYVALEDGNADIAVIPYDGDMNNLTLTRWQAWHILLEDYTDPCNVDLGDIEKIYLGFGDRTNNTIYGGKGEVRFDDIRLYVCREGGSDLDTNGDCIIDYRDLAQLADEWLGTGLWPVPDGYSPVGE